MPFVQWYRKTRGIIRQGLRADQPPVADVLEGTLYGVTDEDDIIERSDGSAWQPYSPTGTGDVVGPVGATDTALARFNGITGQIIQNSLILLSNLGVLTFPDNVRQTFNPGANQAGLNVGANAGDPSVPVDGDLWYDSVANQMEQRRNGVTLPVGSGDGDVDGPVGATDEAIARFDGVTGQVLQDTPVTISNTGAFTFPDDIRQTFNPGANAAGINVGAQAGDPGTPVNGDVWYDSVANELKARINGATVSLGAGGGTSFASALKIASFRA